MMKRKRYVEAMESVTVETVTARLVGMEINVNSSAISPPGRARGDARLQTAESAVAEGLVCAVSVPATTSTPLETGETFMGTPVSVTRGTVELSMTDTPMTSVQVMGNVIVEDATAEQAGMERSVSTHVPARCRPRRASGSAKAGVLCPAPEGVSVNVADVHATLPEIAGSTAGCVSVTTAAVKTLTVWSAEAMAHVPVVAVFVSEAGLESSASIPGSAI